MPSKNRVKVYLENSYYHLYNRGVNKRVIFKDEEDYAVFLNLLKRHMAPESQKDKKGREYVNLYQDIELLAFCLMPNHFHLFIYQHTQSAIKDLMRLVLMSYTTYFNKKYRRIGPLFQDTYKASLITNDNYVLHISRYIHLNPREYRSWPYSSLAYFIGAKTANWVRPSRVLDMFSGKDDYLKFVADYVDYKRELDTIKSKLANS